MKNKKIIAMGMTLLMTAAPAATALALSTNNNDTSDSVYVSGDSVDSSEFDEENMETLPDFETEETAVGEKETIDDEKPDSQGEIAVCGKYLSYADAAEVISVDLSWDSMNFTYAATKQGTWNPTDHSYTDANTSGWVKNSADIKAVNHSNTALTACLSFDPAEEDGASGSFSTYVLSLENAETNSLGEPDQAPSGSTTFTVDGTIDRTKQLGTITVKLKDIVFVTDVSVLKNAYENGGAVTLIGTTVAGGSLPFISSDTVLNLNNQTLKCNKIYINEGKELIVNGPGTLNIPFANGYIGNDGTLIFENCTVDVHGPLLSQYSSHSGQKTLIRSGTFTSNHKNENQFYIGGGKLEIQDGQFTAKTHKMFYASGDGNIVISGGTFTASEECEMFYVGGNATITITGGSFNQDPSAYVAEGYEAVCNEATEYYNVMRKTD